MPSYKPVTAALRVLEILAAVNYFKSGAKIGEIHRRTGIDKATIVRMLETLAFGGYVFRDSDRGFYHITGKTLTFSSSFDRHRVIGSMVAQQLSDFRQVIDWPSDVAILDHDAMLVVQSSRQEGPLSFNRVAGFRGPILGTSLGLAYLANCGEEEREQIISRIINDPSPWNQIAHSPEILDQKLADIRKKGYATMDESYSQVEYGSRIFSIGVPIMRGTELFGSVNIIYLTSALTKSGATRTLLAPLKLAAQKLAERLSESAKAAV